MIRHRWRLMVLTRTNLRMHRVGQPIHLILPLWAMLARCEGWGELKNLLWHRGWSLPAILQGWMREQHLAQGEQRWLPQMVLRILNTKSDNFCMGQPRYAYRLRHFIQIP